MSALTVDTNQVSQCSLNDRRPVADEDEVVVLLTPDHQGLPDVEKIAGILGGDDDTPVRYYVLLFISINCSFSSSPLHFFIISSG